MREVLGNAPSNFLELVGRHRRARLLLEGALRDLLYADHVQGGVGSLDEVDAVGEGTLRGRRKVEGK